ncbi:MAG: ice-binding family protein [Bacteriovorax sp.]
MKRKQLFISILMSLGLMITACGKKAEVSPRKTHTTGSNTETVVTPVPNHATKPLDLGTAKSFGVVAYTSITSAPTSNISGKVGLKPGVRALIALNPATEVAGGASEIYAGDDVGDNQDYITMAREDLIAAYRDAVARAPDKDKLEAYGGNIGGKILPPGVYHFSNGATAGTDLSLEGSDTDVWIFQITGNLNVAKDVRINLSGGAQAKNIFWQVSGKVTMEPFSVVAGTVISQLTFEMKQNAQIVGRAVSKNGKILMSQNTITKP